MLSVKRGEGKGEGGKLFGLVNKRNEYHWADNFRKTKLEKQAMVQEYSGRRLDMDE